MMGRVGERSRLWVFVPPAAGRRGDVPEPALPTDLLRGCRAQSGSGAAAIVVGVDGSSASLAALRWAVREAACGNPPCRSCAPGKTGETGGPVRLTYLPAGRRGGPSSRGRPAAGQRGRVLGPASLVPVTVQVAEGLAARVLLDHAAGADAGAGQRARCAPDGTGRWPGLPAARTMPSGRGQRRDDRHPGTSLTRALGGGSAVAVPAWPGDPPVAAGPPTSARLAGGPPTRDGADEHGAQGERGQHTGHVALASQPAKRWAAGR